MHRKGACPFSPPNEGNGSTGDDTGGDMGGDTGGGDHSGYSDGGDVEMNPSGFSSPQGWDSVY